jgi:hypothetical protein
VEEAKEDEASGHRSLIVSSTMRVPSGHPTILHACLIALGALGCGGLPPAQDPAPSPAPPLATVAPSPALPLAIPEPVDTGANIPPPLAEVAAQFGLTMLGDGWTWKAISRKDTRFDWSGRPASGESELLYSFWRPKIEEIEARLLPQIVASAAANLSNHDPCRPFEQPPEIVKILGVDRVITVCFEPMPFYGKEFRQGVLHGIVQKGALTIAAVFSNNRAAVLPLAKIIGARGATSTVNPR